VCVCVCLLLSDYAILAPKILSCRGQDYTLFPDQSSHAVFNGARDVIEKAGMTSE